MDYSLPASSVHGMSKKKYWSGLSFPSLGDLPHSGIESASPALAGRVFTTKPPGKPLGYDIQSLISRNSSRRSGQSGKSVSRRVWCGDCAFWLRTCLFLPRSVVTSLKSLSSQLTLPSVYFYEYIVHGCVSLPY